MDTSENSESVQLPIHNISENEVLSDGINIEQTCEDRKTDDAHHAHHEFVIPALPTCTKANKKEEKQAGVKVNKAKDVNINDVNKVTNNTNEDELRNKGSAPNPSVVRKETCKDKKYNFPYTAPSWAGVPTDDKKYFLTVLKEGIVKDTVHLHGKSYLTFGRHPNACDVLVEHPSSSRYHAVLQYCVEEKDIRKVGYYLYDLGSTHGCYVNKEKVRPKVYVRIRVGYQIKFGLSSRIYIVEGPEEDQEDEIDMEEVRKQRIQNKKAKTQLSNKNGSTGNDDDDGASWGFGDDAEEEELDLKELMEKKKSVEVKDPKKTLKGFFEREGLDFEYETSERGRGNSIVHVAQVRLPIESSLGVDVIAEGTGSNKKDAVLNCAMDACKIIQAYDMMQNPCKEDERLKRQRELEANDFYDSDDDNYLDRTGSVEKKRMKRKLWAGKQDNQEIYTHESLKEKLEENVKVLFTLEEKLRLSNEDLETEDTDSLDAYMSNIKNKLDKKSKSEIKRQILELKKEIEKLGKLVEKSQPALPAFSVERKEEQSDAKDKFGTKDVLDSCEKSICETEVDANAIVAHKQKMEIVNHQEPTLPQKKKKKRMYGAAMMPLKKKDAKKIDDETNLVEWQPPEGQTGDGKTHLNAKFGY